VKRYSLGRDRDKAGAGVWNEQSIAIRSLRQSNSARSMAGAKTSDSADV